MKVTPEQAKWLAPPGARRSTGGTAWLEFQAADLANFMNAHARKVLEEVSTRIASLAVRQGTVGRRIAIEDCAEAVRKMAEEIKE